MRFLILSILANYIYRAQDLGANYEIFDYKEDESVSLQKELFANLKAEYIEHRPKVLLPDNTTESIIKKEELLNNKTFINSETESKEILPELPHCQFYFTLTNIAIYNKQNFTEEINLLVLSIHRVPTYFPMFIGTKVLLLRDKSIFDFFTMNYRMRSTNHHCESFIYGSCLMQINEGYMQVKNAERYNSKAYISRFLYFDIDKFVQLLKKDKNIFSVQLLLKKWKRWKKQAHRTFKLNINGKKHEMYLKFWLLFDNYFLIDQSITLIKTQKKQFGSSITKKIVVRVNEDNLNELDNFIESFEQE